MSSGLAPGRDGRPRYALDVDVEQATVTIGTAEELLTDHISTTHVVWAHEPVVGDVLVQCSAHGPPLAARISPASEGVTVQLAEPQRRIAPGQSVVFYAGDVVLGGAIVTR